jgi:hypothetical protein
MERRLMLAPTHPLQLALGLVVWSAWFVALYGGMSVGCAVAPPDVARGPFTWINGALLVLTVLTLAPLLYWSLRCWRARPGSADRERRFIAAMGAAVHLVAAGAVVAIGLPILVLPPCIP